VNFLLGSFSLVEKREKKKHERSDFGKIAKKNLAHF